MKRILLLSTLIFGLALSGCSSNPSTENPNDNPDQETVADVNQTCNSETKCKDGLACVLEEGQSSEGKCVKPCNNNGDCDDDSKECKSGVAVLGGQTASVCRAKEPVKNDLGGECATVDGCKENLVCVKQFSLTNPLGSGKCEKACDENKQCDDQSKVCLRTTGIDNNKVFYCEDEGVNQEGAPLGGKCTNEKQCRSIHICVAAPGKTDEGTCQELCNQTDGCDEPDKTCQTVKGLGSSQVKACLAPVERKEGEECRENEVCEKDTVCLAKLANDKVGICTKATPCDINAPSCAEPNQECYEERGLNGATHSVCLPKWCESESDCDTSKKEVCATSVADMTRGHCVEGCNLTKKTGCAAGETCVLNVLVRGTYNTYAPAMCVDEKLKDGAVATQHCDKTKPCQDPRLSCVQNKCTIPCDVPGFRTQCITPDQNATNDWCLPKLDETNFPGQMFCAPVKFVPEEWRTAKENEPCGKTQICDTDKGLRCLLSAEGAESGTCVKLDSNNQCEFSTDCTGGKKCQYKYGPGLLLGASYSGNNYFGTGFKTCQD